MKKIWIHCVVAAICLFAGVFRGNDALFAVTPEKLAAYRKTYGPRAVKRLNALLELMNTGQFSTEHEKIQAVNRFFNQVPYRSDIKAWGKNDFWASRLEFLGKGMGDCEDYAVAKYLTLIQLGVPQEKLFMTYVKVRGFPRNKAAHMVVSYYPDIKAVPLVLDNYDKRILPATRRKDLVPVFSFTGHDLFLQKHKGLGKHIDPSNIKSLKRLRAIDLEIRKG